MTPQDKLKAALEKIFQELLKQGYEIKNAPELIKNITARFEKENIFLFDNDFDKPDVKKSLQLACLAEANPMNKFDYTILFKTQKEINEKSLAAEIKNVLAAALLLKPGSTMASEKALDELSERLAKELLKNKFNDELVCEKKGVLAVLLPCVDLVSEQLRDQRIRDYGVDTTTPGAVQSVVQRAPESDYTTALPAFGKSFEGEKLDPEIGKPDPLGIKDLIISPNEEKEIIIKKMIEKFVEERLLPSTAPRPTTPGTAA